MKDLVVKANQKYEGGMVEAHLLNMLARLDYNNYYSRVFGGLHSDEEEEEDDDDQPFH